MWYVPVDNIAVLLPEKDSPYSFVHMKTTNRSNITACLFLARVPSEFNLNIIIIEALFNVSISPTFILAKFFESGFAKVFLAKVSSFTVRARGFYIAVRIAVFLSQPNSPI